MSLPRIDFSPFTVLVVGDLMLDRYWFGDVSRISPEAPVPVVKVGRVEERLGGAANVARNLAGLGVQALLIGVIGDDEPGRQLERLAADQHVQAMLVRDPLLPTTIKLRVIGRQQQLLRIDFERTPALAALDRQTELLRSELARADVLMLSDYGKGALSHIEPMIAMARAAGIRVVADPKGEEFERYRGVTVLTPNRSELREVVGGWRDEADLVDRAQALRRSLDVEYLLLTRSEEGMTLFGDQLMLNVPAQAREVYDVSGAGDTVAAVLSAMLAAGRSIESAVRLANRAGGIVVGKLGTASVSPEELFDKELL